MKFLKFRNVIPLNYAASDTETTVTMVIPTYQSRHGIDIQGNVYEGKGDNFYEAKIIRTDVDMVEPAAKSIVVKTKTIDSLFAYILGIISFIKCDVEGHELECILGSLNVIRKDQPALLIEVMGDPLQTTSSAFRLFEILRNEGYLPYYLKDQFLRPFKERCGEINFFFLMPHHLVIVNSLLTD
jgi:FkbM family methyltransferase